MALGHGPLKKRRPARILVAGRFAILYIAVLASGSLAGLLAESADGWRTLPEMFDQRLFQVTRFTLYQAALSTMLSILPALVVARAISRHPRFPGRALLLRLFAIPLALPAIVAALGVLALYGRAGILAEPLSALTGGSWPGIYGMSGILIAHVFFNLPLATRLFLEALDTIPNDHWRLASQLGMSSWAEWRLIEWPVLRNHMPGIAGLVLMLCVTSFTIVLTLGGGPRATTLEVAIYQTLRFDFEPARAVVLTMIQLTITLALVAASARFGGQFATTGEIALSARRYANPSLPEMAANAAVIVLAGSFVLGPMIAVVISGLEADLPRLAGESSVRRAVLTSLLLALAAAAMALVLSLALIAARKSLEEMRRRRGPGLFERLCDQGALMTLAIPPVVIGAGWFVLLRRAGDVFVFAPLMVIAVNAAMAMPFVMRALRPAYDRSVDRHGRLAASLGMRGLSRWRLVEWPVLRGPIATGFAFAMALSLGDLGVIALFGSESVQTLPYLLLLRLGSYRTADAAGLALLLTLLTFALMWLAGRGGVQR